MRMCHKMCKGSFKYEHACLHYIVLVYSTAPDKVVILLDLIILILYQIICYGYSLKLPHRGNFIEYPQHMIFSQTIPKRFQKRIFSIISGPVKTFYCLFPPLLDQGVISWKI